MTSPSAALEQSRVMHAAGFSSSSDALSVSIRSNMDFVTGSKMKYCLSTFRSNKGLFKKKSGSIGQGQIIRDRLKVRVKLFPLYGDGFEQKRFASHVQRHLCHFPMARGDLGPSYRELTALFEVPQQPTGELNRVHDLAIDADQALLLRVNPDLARHFVKNLSLTGRRLEVGIGFKDQFD